jgi:hypothetical protein
MAKILISLSAAADPSWKKSKWFPKKVPSGESATKLAYDNMLKEALQSFPAPIIKLLQTQGVHVGGNSVFDAIPDFMYDFEEAAADWLFEVSLENFYKNITTTGKFFTKLHTQLSKCMKTWAAYNKLNIDSKYPEYSAAVKKIKMPVISISSDNSLAPKTISYEPELGASYVQMFANGKLAEQFGFDSRAANSADLAVANAFLLLVSRTERGYFQLFTDTWRFKSTLAAPKPASKKDYTNF